MNRLKKTVRKVYLTLSFVTIIIICAAVVAIQKIRYLSADPAAEKDCTSINPLSDNYNPHASTVFSFQLPWVQKGGLINDASCVDTTAVHGIVRVTNTEDVKNALLFARDQKLKVSIAGVKHSMGGHAFYRNAVVLDMTKFNAITLDEPSRTVRVQAGATWHDIQNTLHPKYAVKAMQSTDIFTVGGSISVNAHGMDHQVGALEKTIRSLTVMLPDGTVETISRTQNTDLYRHIVGGYGLFGIILEAELDITQNAVYEAEHRVIDYTDFPLFFEKTIRPEPKYGLMYGHLSTAPQSFLKEMIVYTYKEANGPYGDIAPLSEIGSVQLRRFVINISKYGPLAQRLKWFAEKHIEPRIQSCTVSRNQAMKDGEACLVSRNDPMHDSVPYLRNNLKQETDILHEYFIPRTQFIPFVDKMRSVLTKNNANVLNASVRVVHPEDTALSYAPEDMFSVVLYINQHTDTAGHERMRQLTRELINLTIRHKGRFFLPYQLHYTPQQLVASYPMITTFFAKKKQYDSQGLLTNTWYETYAPQVLTQ